MALDASLMISGRGAKHRLLERPFDFGRLIVWVMLKGEAGSRDEREAEGWHRLQSHFFVIVGF